MFGKIPQMGEVIPSWNGGTVYSLGKCLTHHNNTHESWTVDQIVSCNRRMPDALGGARRDWSAIKG